MIHTDGRPTIANFGARGRARPRTVSAKTLRALIARELGELTEQESLELTERLMNELVASGRYES